MELICPECMGTLESRDGRDAVCTTHGGHFQILFVRPSTVMAPDAPPVAFAIPAAAAGSLACAQHPASPAAYACSDCGKGICAVCSFDQPNGSHLCPDCAQRRVVFGTPAAAATASMPPLIGVRCIQHPNVQATAQCKLCGAFMCNTCKFDLPGGIQICPSCAANPNTALTRKQTIALVGSYIAAAWCTLVMAAMFGGAFRSFGRDKAMVQLLGFIMIAILLVPSITGLCLGLGSMRRNKNPISVWIATVWNAVILGGFLMLMIIGMLKQGAR